MIDVGEVRGGPNADEVAHRGEDGLRDRLLRCRVDERPEGGEERRSEDRTDQRRHGGTPRLDGGHRVAVPVLAPGKNLSVLRGRKSAGRS